MAEPSLKVVSDSPSISEGAKSLAKKFPRKRLRMILLVGLPLIALAIGAFLYLGSGRYITTDNAYVGAPKVLITPDISGKVSRVIVREGQRVKAGDELFEIDREPFRIAVDQTQAKLASVRADFTNLKSDYQVYSQLADVAQQNADLKKKDVERKRALAESRAGSLVDLDTSISAQLTAQLQAQLAVQRKDQAFNQLLGDPKLPIEKFPAYMQAAAALEQAQRDLDHTLLRAPIDGMATQVDNIQLGRFVTAGTPVFAVIDDSAPWVDANPKETDITNLQVGQRATVFVDTFPDTTFFGTVESVSPGTGAQFAILPPQNASGNWVKVVQRVPLRVRLDKDPMTGKLRAGMSAYVEIDTGNRKPIVGASGDVRHAADQK
ncbi:MAG: rane fusion protein multidrug efflux system [Alphaproteobacteria bacterium]|nr:rane fusion protein multidrug efflux system [Alphaproteobacteria bacterium]